MVLSSEGFVCVTVCRCNQVFASSLGPSSRNESRHQNRQTKVPSTSSPIIREREREASYFRERTSLHMTQLRDRRAPGSQRKVLWNFLCVRDGKIASSSIGFVAGTHLTESESDEQTIVDYSTLLRVTESIELIKFSIKTIPLIRRESLPSRGLSMIPRDPSIDSVCDRDATA